VPIYEYIARDPDSQSCAVCRGGFELLRRMSDPPLESCPTCGAPVRKVFSRPAVGRSISSLDDRAKSAGFHKLKRLGKGEYEKKY
jgi:putative FmdB family regulatory protein